MFFQVWHRIRRCEWAWRLLRSAVSGQQRRCTLKPSLIPSTWSRWTAFQLKVRGQLEGSSGCFYHGSRTRCCSMFFPSGLLTLLSLSVSPCRAAVYQWHAGPHWPRGPPDQRGHSHPLCRHYTSCSHQNTLQHTHLAGQRAECNRLVCLEGEDIFLLCFFLLYLCCYFIPILQCNLSGIFFLQVTLCPWWTWYLCSREL